MKQMWKIKENIRRKRRMNISNLEVIGIDHGWSMMKTVSQVFVT